MTQEEKDGASNKAMAKQLSGWMAPNRAVQHQQLFLNMLASTALGCAGLCSVGREHTITTKPEMEDEAGTRPLLSYCCQLRMSNSLRCQVCMCFEHTDPWNTMDFLLQAIGWFL